MSDKVEFVDEGRPRGYGSVYGQAPTGTALTRLLIKYGFAKDQRSAQLVLLVVGVAAVLIAVVAPLVLGSKPSGPKLTPQDIQRMSHGEP